MVIEVSIKWAESDVRQIYPLEKKLKKNYGKPVQNHEENRIRGEKILVCHF